ncbi:hypothetical protein [uncultured Desulfobacter sp.]|uniref:hypothetical protein n=1 Tax=uncultured Desulfobacter sp. TaxID=240139 RepID=UPI002AAC3948|nr:hypothetical protein [uncultured Desulfobacter sp.]
MRSDSLRYRFVRIGIISLMLLTTGGYVGAQQETSPERYMEMLDSPNIKTRTDAAKYISRFGMKDPVLFDAVKAKLLATYPHPTSNFTEKNEIGWYCKALASSGDMAYADVLKEVVEKTSSDVVRKHCHQSLDQISVYARRNKIIQDGIGKDDTLSLEEEKMIALIRSQSPKMMRDAAKTIFRNPFPGQAVTDAMSEELLNACAHTTRDRMMVDAMAWMCKALGASGHTKYKATLTRVIEMTNNFKIKDNAQKGLSLL